MAPPTYGATIERIPKAGGMRESLASSQGAGGIYVDAQSVYWVEQEGSVWKVDK
jgi:hypothetical protein